MPSPGPNIKGAQRPPGAGQGSTQSHAVWTLDSRSLRGEFRRPLSSGNISWKSGTSLQPWHSNQRVSPGGPSPADATPGEVGRHRHWKREPPAQAWPGQEEGSIRLVISTTIFREPPNTERIHPPCSHGPLPTPRGWQPQSTLPQASG